MPAGFVPDRGDLLWITLDPQAGHEQAGRRPAVVLSPASYNAKAGLCLCCPVTSRVKGYPFEIAIPPGLPISGVVLADQVKCLDWTARDADRIGALSTGIVSDVLAKLHALL
jgi:mRNA interferase MazF